MKILAIETSCDETAIALLEASGGLRAPKFNILKNIISSQVKIHRLWGGVVPNLAKREHSKNLPIIYQKIFEISNFKFQISNLDTICATVGPGLEPALWTGIEFAKQIYKDLKPQNPNLKLVGVNHLEGHIYSFLLTQKTGISNYKFLISKSFPAIALIVSGGHTILLKMDSLTKWKKLGETRDDAVGEAFDKVAKMLGLQYPGGPEIEKLAKKGNQNAINFPRPMINQKNYDFSFSGLKTSVLYYIRDNLSTNNEFNTNIRIGKFETNSLFADIAASFQQAAIDVLISKTIRAAKEFKAKSIMLSGGVAANKQLRKMLKAKSYQLKANFFAPPMQFNTDNAVMIAAAAYINCLRKKNRKISAQANLNL